MRTGKVGGTVWFLGTARKQKWRDTKLRFILASATTIIMWNVK